MLGAISGDIVGSPYEFHPWQGDKDDFPLFNNKSEFTDDTVLTCALANALMSDWRDDAELRQTIVNNFCEYAPLYPNAGYGGRFRAWILQDKRQPYNSFGNGSAMRVSPVGWAFASLPEVEKYAALSADVTHNHPEGVKGAQAVAGAIFLARTGKSKNEIRDYLTASTGYDLNRILKEIKPVYCFDETCQGSVPEALIAFLESDDFESAIRGAVWLGGDADTQAAITGSVAEAFYGGVPEPIKTETLKRLDSRLTKDLENWQKWLKTRAKN